MLWAYVCTEANHNAIDDNDHCLAVACSAQCNSSNISHSVDYAKRPG